MGETVIPDPVQSNDEVVPDPLPKPAPPTVSVSAARPTGLSRMGVGEFLQHVQNYLITGSGAPADKPQGFQGFGDNPIGQFMGSLPIGLTRLAKGYVQRDLPEMVGGAAQASSMPAAFMSPEISQAAAELPPSRPYAGQLFQQLMSKLRGIPVDPNPAGQTALEIQQLASAGGRMPKVVMDFLRRTTNPEAPPMDYEFARQLYSNATRLSADEAARLTPAMRQKLAEFTSNLGGSIQQTASQHGLGDMLQDAMTNYRRGSQVSQALKAGARAVAVGGAAGLGGYLAKRAVTNVTK